MNAIGQTFIAINVETCSVADRMLVRAHRLWRDVAKYFKHTVAKIVTVDNPHRDGPGVQEAVFAGDGLPEVRVARDKVVLVETEAECDEAVKQLRVDLRGSTRRRVGFDTENIAYIPPHIGRNSEEAAIAQLYAGGEQSYIFLFYKWGGVCYPSFLEFMSDASIKKEALGVSRDVTKFLKRFPNAGRRGAAPWRTAAASLRDGRLRQISVRVGLQRDEKLLGNGKSAESITK